MPPCSLVPERVAKLLDHVRSFGHRDIDLYCYPDYISPLLVRCNQCDFYQGEFYQGGLVERRASWVLHLTDPPSVRHGLWRWLFDTDSEVGRFLIDFETNLEACRVATQEDVKAIFDLLTIPTRFNRGDVV